MRLLVRVVTIARLVLSLRSRPIVSLCVPALFRHTPNSALERLHPSLTNIVYHSFGKKSMGNIHKFFHQILAIMPVGRISEPLRVKAPQRFRSNKNMHKSPYEDLCIIFYLLKTIIISPVLLSMMSIHASRFISVVRNSLYAYIIAPTIV